ncbi:uncharacterized protein BJ212DRAFT_1477899 [Suillus subaureus]|uniref:Uncharacterized protein n=1 Tax=Suillus subaureus TaxID=48587 RepID=A0A9P7JH70_9AGAM|nr:uncharacterized protein BJ212DRAFT_1477899 [Suillus subaureus]KAG1822070.1 hypothetical protein BJ212DRAFT_1477899 [Suillus subaureus]
MAIQQCLALFFLSIFFILPYVIVVLPSILGLQTYSYNLIFTLVALTVIILIGNLYYLSSLASQYFGALNHSLGCASQLVNWVIILTYLIAISLRQVEIPVFPMMVILVEGTRVPSLLADRGAWHILEQYLTTEMTYPQMEAAFASYLGNRYNADDWKEACDALFSGNDDNSLTLANLLALKARHVPQGASSTLIVITLWKDSAISVSASKAAVCLKAHTSKE